MTVLCKEFIIAHVQSSTDIKSSYRSVKQDTAPVPVPVVRALEKLGHDLSLARRRRMLTQESMAERIQTSVATLASPGEGRPAGLPLESSRRRSWYWANLTRFPDFWIRPLMKSGLSLMNEQLPQRVRNKKRTVSSGAL
jgi:hypothetical protein